MMKLKTWTNTLVLLSSSVLLSCVGGIPQEPLDATTGPFVLGSFGQSLNSLPTSNNVPALPIAGVSLNSIELKSLASCESVEPSTTVDADNDGIAASKKYTYNCQDVVDNGFSYSRKGTVEIKDMDETVAGVYGGLRVDYNVPLFKMTDLSTGAPYENTHSGYWDYRNVGGSVVSNSEYTGSNKYKAQKFENDYAYTFQWNYKMTPTDMSQPWKAGTVSIDGSYSLSGKFVYEDASGVHSQREGGWKISYSTKDLVFDDTCGRFYKSGSMIIDDGVNKIEIVYECSSAKLFVNGSESDWWAP